MEPLGPQHRGNLPELPLYMPARSEHGQPHAARLTPVVGAGARPASSTNVSHVSAARQEFPTRSDVATPRIGGQSAVNNDSSRNGPTATHEPKIQRPLHGSVRITQEDRQEGYDVDLLNLQPRNTASNANGGKLSPTASEHEPHETEKHLMNGKSRAAYPSRQTSTAPRPRSKNPKSRSTRKRKRKPIPWFKRPVYWFLICVVIVIVAVAVSLGVVFGTKSKKSPSTPSTSLPPISVSSAAGPGSIGPTPSVAQASLIVPSLAP